MPETALTDRNRHSFSGEGSQDLLVVLSEPV